MVLTLALLYLSYRKKNRLYRAIVAQNSDFINRERILREQLEAASRPVTPPAESSPAESSPTLDRSKTDDLMGRFSELMMERKVFTDPTVSINNVADMLGTNRTYLSKAINESTGKTFTQIISDYRIHEAIKLVSDLESNLPLKVIANNVGFNSLSTFYSAFQSVTGMPPARYRSHLMNM